MTMARHQTFFELRSIVSTHPGAYRLAARLRGNRQIVGRRSDLVIDGFPRSANSTAEAAIRLVQRQELDLAHHCHSAAQFHLALRYGVPAVLLFRSPIDAVLSYKDALPDRIGFRALLRSYIRLHRSLMPHLDRLILVCFEDVTRDLVGTLNRIARESGVDLNVPSGGAGFAQQVADKRDKISQARTGTAPRYSPVQSEAFQAQREQRSARLRAQLMSPRLEHLRAEATEYHGALTLARTAQLLRGDMHA